MGQSLPSRVGVQSLVGVFAELAKKFKLYSGGTDGMAVSRYNMVDGETLRLQPEEGEAISADFCAGDTADLMGFILIVKENIALLNWKGVIADGVRPKTTIDRQKLAERSVAVHEAVVLRTAELLFCNIQKRGRLFVFKRVGKRVCLKKAVHLVHSFTYRFLLNRAIIISYFCYGGAVTA